MQSVCTAEKPATVAPEQKIGDLNGDGKVDEPDRFGFVYSKDQIQQAELDEFMTKTFEGSLPAFIAAFGKRQALSEKDIEEIQRIIQG